MTVSKPLVGVSGLLMAVALATPGCATKKYVRQQTSPIQQRVEEVDKKHAEALANLEGKEQKDVSRVEERAMSAENKATDAARAAQQADNKATEATQAARSATDLAQQAQTKLGDLSNQVQNIDNYKLVTSGDVMFGFDRATLTPEGRAKLDQFLQQAQAMSRYVLEVEGFTDRIGPRDYNLALSRRRADAVVRYLVDHGVPLRRIHMIGLGAEQPPAAGQAMAGQPGMTQPTAATESGGRQTTRMKAKEMRRVILNLYAPESTLSASTSPQPTTQTPPSQPQPPRQ